MSERARVAPGNSDVRAILSLSLRRCCLCGHPLSPYPFPLSPRPSFRKPAGAELSLPLRLLSYIPLIAPLLLTHTI